MPLRPLIVLFHANAGIEYTLEQIFQSLTWTHIDMATMTQSPIDNFKKRLHSIEKPPEVLNVYIRYQPNVYQGFLNNIYVNSRCLRLKVVVHFNEFVHESLTPMCLLNSDWILVKKRGINHGWNTRLFEATGIPLEQVDASTCDLVGANFTSHCAEFVELRYEDEASRDRIRSRCAAVTEELMQVTWHPDRVRRLITTLSTGCDCYVDNM